MRSLRSSASSSALCLQVKLADSEKPVVEQAQFILLQGRLHAAATVMAAHDDVAHPQPLHRILQDGEAVEVDHLHLIGDVAMEEDLARHDAHAFVARDTAVGTTDPQHARRLVLGKSVEKFRIFPVYCSAHTRLLAIILARMSLSWFAMLPDNTITPAHRQPADRIVSLERDHVDAGSEDLDIASRRQHSRERRCRLPKSLQRGLTLLVVAARRGPLFGGDAPEYVSRLRYRKASRAETCILRWDMLRHSVGQRALRQGGKA